MTSCNATCPVMKSGHSDPGPGGAPSPIRTWIITQSQLPLDTRASLIREFSESDLPWKVDVVDWSVTNDTFREIIRRERVVLCTSHV